jgi:Tfp pilus assembly protein PilV
MKWPENHGLRRRNEGVARSVRAREAFTLIEVMIAVAIFFMGMFAILGVLSSGLHAASILRRNGPTAGMAVAELTQTNKLEEGTESGNFGELYPDYTYTLEKREVATNGLFQVDVTVLHGNDPYSSMSILLYRPQSDKK